MVMTLVNPTTSTTDPELKDEWRTPPALFAHLDARYGPFTLDVAANSGNTLCPLWLGPGSEIHDDALTISRWGLPGEQRRVFCNPPYSRGMVAKFVQKAYTEAKAKRARVCLLLPAVTEVPWWHLYVWDAERGKFRVGVTVEFLKPRVKFHRPDGTVGGSGGIGSAVIHFGRVG